MLKIEISVFFSDGGEVILPVITTNINNRQTLWSVALKSWNLKLVDEKVTRKNVPSLFYMNC